MKRIEKPWGYEEWWAETDKYVGKFLFIKKRERLSKQHHLIKDETIHIMSGIMMLIIFDSKDESSYSVKMKPGDTYHISPGVVHRMHALEDTLVIEVSTPETDDIIRHEDDYGRVIK